MASANDALMPGPEGRTPRSYDVSHTTKTDSYINAVSNNPLPPAPPKLKGNKWPKATEDEPDSEEDVGGRLKRNPDQIGLTQEELEPFRDQPFWRRLRCCLFVSFWLLWLLLFLLALLILFLSPKCSVKLRPSWWQSAVAYHVWLPSFADGDGDGMGDVNGLVGRLDQLRKAGVHSLWPRPFLLTDEFSDAVRDFRALDSKLGVNTDAKKLIDAAHSRGMKMIIDFPIATTSLEHYWFLRSQPPRSPENKDFGEFYVWRKPPANSSFFSSPPSAKGDQSVYLHKENQPKSAVLNWQSGRLRMQIFEALSEWIDRGIDGFHLTGIDYLARSADFSEPNWKEIVDLIADIRNHVTTYANETATPEVSVLPPPNVHHLFIRCNDYHVVFASMEDAKEKDKRKLVSNLHLNSLINYELTRIEKNSKICHKNEGSVGTCVYEILSDLLLFHSLNEDVPPHWELGNSLVPRLASRVGSRLHAELLLMLQLLLPGTNSVYYGDEIGMRNLPNDSKVEVQRGAMQWDDSPGGGFSSIPSPLIPLSRDYKNVNWERQYSENQSPLKTFLKLSKLRQREEVLVTGKTLMGNLVDRSAFTMARFIRSQNVTTGNIFVIGVNFSSKLSQIPLDLLPSQSTLSKAEVVAVSSNTVHLAPRDSLFFKDNLLELPPDHGILFKYPSA